MGNKKLTTFEASCIVTGNGIGGGLMALPFLAQRAGWPGTALVLCFAYLVTVALHFMVAEMLLSAKNGSGILSIFSEFLFRGRLKAPLTAVFFALLLVTLLFNLCAYIAGGADIISDLTGAPPALSKAALYAFAVIVPIMGLKPLGVSEKAAVIVMIAMTAALTGISFMKGGNALPVLPDGASAVIALYGLSMFSFSALFSVPQAVCGLGHSPRAIKVAIALGVGVNLLMSLAICFSVLRVSQKVTEVAIVGWSASLGAPVRLVSSLLVLCAMITSYWAISLALSDMVREQLNAKGRKWPVYIASTLPCLLMAMASDASFTSFIGVAGGAVAVIIALLLLPAYCNARSFKAPVLLIGACYVLMAVGSVLAV